MRALNKFPQGLQLLPLTQMAKQKHLILFTAKVKRAVSGYGKWKVSFSGLESGVK